MSKTAAQKKPLTFEDLNTAKNYDWIREQHRNEAGDICRKVNITPVDENDPQEERGQLVVTGCHRIGFDTRTHKAWVKEGEVVIAPLNA